jgi:hypothetical protein
MFFSSCSDGRDLYACGTEIHAAICFNPERPDLWARILYRNVAKAGKLQIMGGYYQL